MFYSISQLEFPTPERLLPIGQHGKEAMTSLAEQIREALSVPDTSFMKQDSLDKSEVLMKPSKACLFNSNNFQNNLFFVQSTGNDVSANSRANSPRRLTKQLALESPTTENKATVGQSPRPRDRTDRAQGLTPNIARREETSHVQRQRIRKAGPFVVDSQSISDSRVKYAGSWAPPAYESDSEAGNVPNTSSAPKPVK